MTRLGTTVIVFAVVATAPRVAGGQALTVQALDASSGRALRGALVTVGDDAGFFVDSELTDGRGLAHFDALSAGDFAVRVEMIGHGTVSRADIRLDRGGRARVSVSLPVLAVRLDGLEVDGEARCTVDEAEAHLASQVWEEVRKALEAARWTADRGLYRYRVRRSVRDLELRSRRVLGEGGTGTSGWGSRPYRSLSADRLHAAGFVQREDGGDVYYAPDEEVLLSDVFLESHCMRAVLGEGSSDGWVGLAFRPLTSSGVPDISGTLWVDPESWELRRLDFSYERLRRAAPVRDVGGSVHFRRLPDGTWIVPEWSIRTPLMGRGTDAQGRPRIFQIGVREEGGRVQEVRQPGGRVVMAAATGVLEGSVLDSLEIGGVADARVILEGAGLEVQTDSAGTFVFSRLDPGSYRVTFDHGSLPEGYRPAPRSVTLEGGEVVSVRLRLPRAGEVVAARCASRGSGGRDRGDALGVAGRVRDAATGLPLSGAWVEVGFEPVGLDDPRRRDPRVRTDGDGRYLACDVPSGAVVHVSARWGPFSSRPRVLDTRADSAGGVVFYDVEIPLQGVGVVSGRVVEAGGGVPIEGAVVSFTRTPEDGVEPLDSDGRRRVETGDDGRFELKDVPAGRHWIVTSHARYREGGDSLAVGPGETVEVEISVPVIDPALGRLLPGLAATVPGPSIEVISRSRPSGDTDAGGKEGADDCGGR